MNMAYEDLSTNATILLSSQNMFILEATLVIFDQPKATICCLKNSFFIIRFLLFLDELSREDEDYVQV